MPLAPGSRGSSGYFSALITTILVGGGLILGTTDFTSYVDLAEIAAPAASSAGEARLYADSTAHRLKASYNTGAYGNVVRETDANSFTATQTFQVVQPDGSNTRDMGSTSAEWRGVYVGEDASSGIYYGADQDARTYYDGTYSTVRRSGVFESDLADMHELTQHYLNGSNTVDDAQRQEALNTIGTGTGTGAGVSMLRSLGGALGLCQMSTGTDATGKATAYAPDTSWLQLGVARTILEVRFRLEDLSDGTDTYTFYIGLNDSSSTGGNGTDGVFLRYTHGTNDGEFEFVTIAGGAETATDTNVVVAADSWTVARFDINAAASSVTCYINGTPAGTNTTNIPTGTQYTCQGASIVKSVGTTARLAYIDFWKMLFDL